MIFKIACLAFIFHGLAHAQPPLGQVISADKEFFLNKKKAQVSDEIIENSEIDSLEAKLVLAFGDKIVVKLDPHSQLRIRSHSSMFEIHLLSGKFYVILSEDNTELVRIDSSRGQLTATHGRIWISIPQVKAEAAQFLALDSPATLTSHPLHIRERILKPYELVELTETLRSKLLSDRKIKKLVSSLALSSQTEELVLHSAPQEVTLEHEIPPPPVLKLDSLQSARMSGRSSGN